MRLLTRWLISAMIILSHSTAFSQSDVTLELSRSIRENILNIARVQFGETAYIAVEVNMRLRNSPQVITEELDMGYLPNMNSSTRFFENEKPLLERIEATNINLVISSRLDSKAIAKFRDILRRSFAVYRPVIAVQLVDFAEPVKKVIEEKKIEEPKEKPLTRTEILNYCFMAACVFFIGVVIYAAFRTAGVYITKAAKIFSSNMLSMKQKTEEGKGKEKKSLASKKTQHSQTDLAHSLKVLRHLCASQPYRVTSYLQDSPENRAGLRWLLSHLQADEKENISVFLGKDRIKRMVEEDPHGENFVLSQWARETVEKLTLLTMDRRVFLEEVLSPEDLSLLFRVDGEALFELALKERQSWLWKIVFEALPPEILSKNAQRISQDEWDRVIEGEKLQPQDVKTQFSMLKPRVFAQISSVRDENGVGQKVILSLVSSIKAMPLGQDQDFIDRIADKQPPLKRELDKQIWTLRNLKSVQPAALKAFVAMQANDSLAALLICSPENDRDFLIGLLPEGIKKSIVMDLFNKAQRGDGTLDKEQSLAMARDLLDDALRAHMNQKLPVLPTLGLVSMDRKASAA
ncbi:hypothetical protein AZI86_10710 [Bdellovibrio bacteriovorus]|uniref:Flagellar motor switch protein FliG C-terminal domain-containing protein n=1 Tax=Bdellovibrio bacteriovorus TaxID=959 RepID=A0A150WL58_BDEBC|nr:hypothetical protein [Bdellovibrio bacteriovorus]KYG64674.1 hypothetical protein AZI86_10710 [Bdellovibrio bacteriovorus]